MKKEITKEEILGYKAKIRIPDEEGKLFNPYPFLPLKYKIGIYAEEVLFSHSGFYWENRDNKTYILEDKYQGTLSDPINLKMALGMIKRMESLGQ